MRGTIEAICNERAVSGPSLEKRITKLGSGGLISKKDVDRLHSIRFLGNDAAHEIKEPSQSQIAVALKIVEHLIAALYTLEREINGELDTTISDFSEFEVLLVKKIAELSVGDSVTLARLMGIDFRRIKDSINLIEDELKKRITDGNFKYMEIDSVSKAGDSDKEIQLYKIILIPPGGLSKFHLPLSFSVKSM